MMSGARTVYRACCARKRDRRRPAGGKRNPAV
jgi:hypothetical protein